MIRYFNFTPSRPFVFEPSPYSDEGFQADASGRRNRIVNSSVWAEGYRAGGRERKKRIALKLDQRWPYSHFLYHVPFFTRPSLQSSIRTSSYLHFIQFLFSFFFSFFFLRFLFLSYSIIYGCECECEFQPHPICLNFDLRGRFSPGPWLGTETHYHGRPRGKIPQPALRRDAHAYDGTRLSRGWNRHDKSIE